MTNMKKRILLDIAMALVFVILLDYRYIHNSGHEIMAVLFTILFYFHYRWNQNWYKNITKGRWNGIRTRLTLINVLLLLAFLAAMITGICISHHLFFLGIRFPLWVHRLHRIAGFSMLILIGLHLGLHWQAIRSQMKRSIHLPRPLVYLSLLAIIAGGIYFSCYYHIGGRLLCIPLAQLGRPPVTLGLFVLGHLLIIGMYTIVSHYVEKVLRH